MAENLLITFSHRYANGPGVLVNDLQLPAKGGGVTVLFGASGSGKTTLLRVLAGLLQPESGQIVMGDEVWFDSTTGMNLPPQKRQLGFVAQDYALFPHLTVQENIGYGMHKQPVLEREKAIQAALQWLGIEALRHRRPSEISGGQQQRVALARAVARRPKLLLLDEPLSALDAPTRRHLRSELHALLAGTGIPAIVVTHDPSEALALADRLVLMDQGRPVQIGRPADVFNHPNTVESATILGVDAVIDGMVLSQQGALTTVQAGAIELTAVSEELLPRDTPVAICIRAEDVTLTQPGFPRGSARNKLTGTVTHLSNEGGLIRVELDCGFLLKAILTRPSCEELDLQLGSMIEAHIKAPNVHLIPRLTP